MWKGDRGFRGGEMAESVRLRNGGPRRDGRTSGLMKRTHERQAIKRTRARGATTQSSKQGRHPIETLLDGNETLGSGRGTRWVDIMV